MRNGRSVTPAMGATNRLFGRVCGPIFKASVFSERGAHFLSAGADYTPRKIAMRLATEAFRASPTKDTVQADQRSPNIMRRATKRRNAGTISTKANPAPRATRSGPTSLEKTET